MLTPLRSRQRPGETEPVEVAPVRRVVPVALVRRGGAGESVYGVTSSVATFAGEVRLMSEKSSGMVGKMDLQ